MAAKAKSLRDTLRDESGSQIKAVVRSILDHVTLEPGKLTLAIDRKNLAIALGSPTTEPDADAAAMCRISRDWPRRTLGIGAAQTTMWGLA